MIVNGSALPARKADGRENDIKSVRRSGPDGKVTAASADDGIQRPAGATEAEGGRRTHDAGRRTRIAPARAIATYVTRRTYDSHDRSVETLYPGQREVACTCPSGGLLEKTRGEKPYGCGRIAKHDRGQKRCGR